ncbi:MAG: flavin reductase [Defluviitaleaceae bacterium]|nr:flavin reductase [Defluviitaleaceae bacterium]
MKKEFSTQPASFTETWPGELDMFSWKDLLAGIPAPLLVVTGWKANGKENACLQSWATFVSTGGEFVCMLGTVPKEGHMYQSLKETGCCVLNFPSRDIYDRCYATIEHNQDEINEITASGLTAEKTKTVNAPRIAECFLNIECEFMWEKEIFENGDNIVIALKAVHMSMDDRYYDDKQRGRYGETGFLYNIVNPRNPETGEVGAEGLGIIQPTKGL